MWAVTERDAEPSLSGFSIFVISMPPDNSGLLQCIPDNSDNRSIVLFLLFITFPLCPISLLHLLYFLPIPTLFRLYSDNSDIPMIYITMPETYDSSLLLSILRNTCSLAPAHYHSESIHLSLLVGAYFLMILSLTTRLWTWSFYITTDLVTKT